MFEYELPRTATAMPDHMYTEDFSYSAGEEKGGSSTNEDGDDDAYFVGLAGDVASGVAVMGLKDKGKEK